MKYTYPEPVVSSELRRYFLEHVERDKKATDGGFYIVKKPLYAFKRVMIGSMQHGIANLTIPVGETIFAGPRAFSPTFYGDDRKLRASAAEVHSIWKLKYLYEAEPANAAFSWHNSTFKYRPNTRVTPRWGFSKAPHVCGDGIHFFLNVADALKYRF